MVLAFAGDSTITKFFAICAMFVQILRKIRKTDCNTELFSTFLLNNVYRTHFESILPCRVFVAFLPQRLSPILPPSEKADGINPVFINFPLVP